MSFAVQFVGFAEAVPFPAGIGASGIRPTVDLGGCGPVTYGSQVNGAFPIAGTVVLAAEIAAIRFVSVRSVRGDSLVLVVTSEEGTDQEIPFSSVVAISCAKSGTPITALSVQGPGEIEYLVAGD